MVKYSEEGTLNSACNKNNKHKEDETHCNNSQRDKLIGSDEVWEVFKSKLKSWKVCGMGKYNCHFKIGFEDEKINTDTAQNSTIQNTLQHECLKGFGTFYIYNSCIHNQVKHYIV